jgi:hypothetical protein
VAVMAVMILNVMTVDVLIAAMYAIHVIAALTIITVVKNYYLSAVPLGLTCGRLAGRFFMLFNPEKIISF